MYQPLKISHVLISVSLLLFPLFSLALSKQCNPYDEKVLLKIKKQFGNPSSLALWDPRTDCCKNWGAPIMCNRKGHVNFLNFGEPEEIPAGPVPPAIGELTFLQTLSLTSSNFSGPFPLAICKLSHLQKLTIDYTSLTGPIPTCLGQLKDLTHLEISVNDLITGPIPKTLAQLTKLTYLQLPMNKLSGPIPDIFGPLRSLEFINLESNHLSGSIPASLGFLPNVTDIHLTGNRLTGSIPASFGSLKSTKVLRLSENRLSGPIPKTMGRIDPWDIDLSSNNFTGDASFLFGSKKKALQTINLSNNRFKFDFSKVDLPLSIRELYMSHNMIYGSLPKRVGQLRLAVIDVSYNQLCGPIPTSRRLKRIKPVYFAHNKCLCGLPLPACK